jgi:hypothetical protein
LNSQDLLDKKEIELNEKLLQLRSAKTDEEIERLEIILSLNPSCISALNIGNSFIFSPAIQNRF